MNDNVVELHPVEVGAGYRFDVGKVFDAAKDQPFDNLLIIGQLEDGELWVSSASNAGEALILIEMAKRRIVFGD